MWVYNGICVYIIPSIDQLALYFTVYCRIVYYGGRVYAMTEGMKKATWLQGLLNDLKIDQDLLKDLLKINCDSMSTIYLAKNQVYHARTKHIDVRFHFIWEILDEGDIKLHKIHTKVNPIDMLTKIISE